jgi:hypothetical protein
MGLATLGIVYLMVVKPDTTDSILALVVAVILGLALSAGAWLQPKSAAPAAKSPD